ncbi:MAG TPA: hypothetical protein VFP68_22325 [Burkholderiaceae bacterium]|nr:hypothetical protein [Burkholderiaceae bacterium]
MGSERHPFKASLRLRKILELITLMKTVLLAPFQAVLICVAMCLALLPESVAAAPIDGVAVNVVNESEPVLCAEKDNVAVSFAGPDVRSFRIEAAHPIYLSSGHRNNWEPDWTACEMSDDPVFTVQHGQQRQVTLYRAADLQIIGHTFKTFWRPAAAVVRIGNRVEKNLHLLQVHVRRAGHKEEVLVLYPQDGYWRARPLSPRSLWATDTPFGSSFLVGPVEMQGRPVVDIQEVRFEPQTRTFTLQFRRGGKGTLKLASVDENRLILEVKFDQGIDSVPFAMLRSMYITEFNNDVAHIALRERGAKGWREENIMKFDRATVTDVWAGRRSPSRHNTLSPDLMFNSFSDETGRFQDRSAARASMN